MNTQKNLVGEIDHWW